MGYYGSCGGIREDGFVTGKFRGEVDTFRWVI